MPPNNQHQVTHFDPNAFDPNNLPNDISFLNVDAVPGGAYGAVLDGASSTNHFMHSPNAQLSSARVPSSQPSHAQQQTFHSLTPLRPSGAALWDPPALSGRSGVIPAAQTMLVTTHTPPVQRNRQRQFGQQQQKQQKLVHPADYIFSSSPPPPLLLSTPTMLPTTKATWSPSSHAQHPSSLRSGNNNDVLMNRSAAPGPNVFGLNKRQQNGNGAPNVQPHPMQPSNDAHGVNLLKFYYEHWPVSLRECDN